MELRPVDAATERQIRRLLESFSANPSDARAFAELEQHLYIAAAWSQLAGVYECRLAGTEESHEGRAEVLLRLARLLEQRLDAPSVARQRYEDLLHIEPQHPEGLSGLRRAHARAGDLAAALQIADIDERVDRPPNERARTLAECGELWQEAGDEDEAERRYREALELDPACDRALARLTELSKRAGRPEAATDLLERRLESLEGDARIEALVQFAGLLPDSDARLRGALGAIVAARPEERSARERLIEIERAAGHRDRVEQLQRGLWEQLDAGEERAELALEAARLQLEKPGNYEVAGAWLERVVADTPEDAEVHRLRVRVHRRLGEPEGLIRALEALEHIDGPSNMRELEIAVLHEREGRPERAIESLHDLLERDPDDDEALAVMDRCLSRLGRHGERVSVLKERIAQTDSDETFANLCAALGDLFGDHLSDADAAEGHYRAALERFEHRTAEEQLKRLLREAQRDEELELLLEESIERTRDGDHRARSCCELAELRLRVRADVEGARASYVQALAASSGCAAALEGLRKLAAVHDDEVAQLAACAHELELDPEAEREGELLEELIGLSRAAGDPRRAHRAAQRWTELDGGEQAFAALAALSREIGDAATESRALQSLIGLATSDSSTRARWLERLGDLTLGQPHADALETAAHCYRESLQLRPSERLRSQLLDIYRRTGQLGELARELRTELEATPGSEGTAARVQLARTLAALGDLEEATDTVMPAFEEDPGDARIGDMLEGFLADQNRLEDLCSVLTRRLAREREPTRRRELAHRLGGLLLDGLGRADDAVAALRELADPSRHAPLEDLFERALDAVGSCREHENWLVMREGHVDEETRADLVLRLASIQRTGGRSGDAIATLRRAQRLLPEPRLDRVRHTLLELVREIGDPKAQVDLLQELISESGDREAQAAYRIDLARVLIDDLDQPGEARGELDALELAALDPPDLRRVVSLFDRAGAPSGQVRAREALAASRIEPDERIRSLRQLALLRSEGPDEVRDDARAEAALRELLALDSKSSFAFEHLIGLLERGDQEAKLIELLRVRLEEQGLESDERTALALRLAGRLQRADELAQAARVLQRAREHDPQNAALAELLFRVLDLQEDARERSSLCAEQARSDEEYRERWLRRWLLTLEQAGAPAEAKLQVLDMMREEIPFDCELARLRIPLLRELQRTDDLAEALEELLEHQGALTGGRRRVAVRELLHIYEGPLPAPVRALGLIERELAGDPALRARGLRLAAHLGDPEREIALLRREGPDDPPPSELKRLGLTLARLGRDAEAEPLLWGSFEIDRHDRDVIEALEAILVPRGESPDLVRLLDAHYPLEPAEGRARVARNGLRLAEQLGDTDAALRWMRRRQLVERLSARQLERWLELERSGGDSAGQISALRALVAEIADDEMRGPRVAELAELLAAGGQLELAREGYEEALRLSSDPPAAWLLALDQILARQGATLRRSGVLRDLTRHPDLDPGERDRYRELRVEVLATLPELREEAAVELTKLVTSEGKVPAEQRIRRLGSLLELYEDLDRTADWCDVAETLVEEVDVVERAELERKLARRLSANGFARERAIARWLGILESAQEDTEALAALASLLDQPGREAERADMLERLGAGQQQAGAAAWIEAARLRWHALRDARAALRDADAALALDPELADAHLLRADVCAFMGSSDEEIASLACLLASAGDGPDASSRWLRLATLYAAQPHGGAQAVEAAERALATAVTPTAALPRVRDVLARAGAFERACELLHQELETAEPECCAELLRTLAQIEWEERGRAPQACSALERLERCDDLRSDDYERWTEALLHLERWGDAVDTQRSALLARGQGAGAEEWLDLARLARERAEDAERARAACDRALALEPNLIAGLALRADLCARAGEFEQELQDLVALAEHQPDAGDAARAFTRAGRLARESLGDDTRGWALYRSALKQDATSLPALLGAGEIAFERREWSEAERMFSTACALLRDDSAADAGPAAGDVGLDQAGPEAGEVALGETPEVALGAAGPEAAEVRPEAELDIGRIAERAAEAALEQHRNGEAFHYLEQSLEGDPNRASSLDAMGRLALRIGAYDRARDCLQTRLAQGDLAGEDRAERLVRLAQAHEGGGELRSAVDVLSDVIVLRPGDEVSRARLVELLEELGEPARAAEQLDGWLLHCPAESRPELGLRAARIQLQNGRRAEARQRLQQLVDSLQGPDEAWLELAELVLADEGAETALGIVGRAVEHVSSGVVRGALLWLQARAFRDQGRLDEAAGLALETLESDLQCVEAAELLAANLGRVSDFGKAVTQLERSLDTGLASQPVEAEIWEALGRAYAGPLENLERAERCYRRSLEANTMRTSAREALADVTAFDPAAHRESVHLHRELLEAFPARPGSWRSFARIATHWRRQRASATCQAVLAALRLAPTQDSGDPSECPLVHTGSSGDPAVRAGTDLLRALNDANLLPDPARAGGYSADLPLPLRVELVEIAGPGWDLADDVLLEIWRRPPEESQPLPEGMARKARRQLQRVLRGARSSPLSELDVAFWREELLAQAAALAVDHARLTLSEALYALIALWPATAELVLDDGGDIPAVTQLCPPAKALLLRVADTTLGALGV